MDNITIVKFSQFIGLNKTIVEEIITESNIALTDILFEIFAEKTKLSALVIHDLYEKFKIQILEKTLLSYIPVFDESETVINIEELGDILKFKNEEWLIEKSNGFDCTGCSFFISDETGVKCSPPLFKHLTQPCLVFENKIFKKINKRAVYNNSVFGISPVSQTRLYNNPIIKTFEDIPFYKKLSEEDKLNFKEYDFLQEMLTDIRTIEDFNNSYISNTDGDFYWATEKGYSDDEIYSTPKLDSTHIVCFFK